MLGLTNREAADRRQQGLGNEQVNSSTRTVKEIVKDNVFTYFNLIFTVLAVLLIVVGSFLYAHRISQYGNRYCTGNQIKEYFG